MKKSFLTSIFTLFVLVSFSQTRLYENPNFDAISKDHKIIAILPFKTTVKLRPKDMKDMSPEQLLKIETDQSYSIQSAMNSWFLQRDKDGNLRVKVQDPATTNAILKKNGISYNNMDQFTPSELANLIGVDAVISGNFETNKPMSEGAGIAVAVLFGVSGSTNKAVMNLFIYNAADGVVLINYNKTVSGSLGSSTEDLVNILMRKASRRIAYAKKD